MFDLPVVTKEQRRDAGHYRNLLLDFGFSQIQLSVYAKYVINATGVRRILPAVKGAIPSGGEVRLLRLTDEQWASTYRYEGPKQLEPEPIPSQLSLFSSQIDAEKFNGKSG
jgi:CRISPR-associated protein Cas2